MIRGSDKLSKGRSEKSSSYVYLNSDVEILLNHGYKLGRIIGEGSFCKVRIVESTDGRHRMAVKIFNKNLASRDFVTRFLPREREILRELHHPHIIQFHRMFDYQDSVFVIMELADKGDMLDYIRQHHNLPEEHVRRYFHQLVTAVQYLHEMQIVHRDLKCENILLTQDDKVKLTDFGFSRRCVDPTTGRRVLSETYCGSAAYAAPEVLQGTPYNPKMYDAWSLGCVLFIMITGTMPFDDSNLKKMIQMQLQRRIKIPSGVTTRCEELIRHILEPDVTRRATVNQVLRHSWLQDAD